MTKQIQTVELPEEVEKRFNDFIIKLKAQIDSVTPVMRHDYLHGWTKSFLAKELAQAEAKAREEERRRLDKLRQMMWELMPKSSDYGGQELTQSHKEQVKGFQECISIIDYELEALQTKGQDER